MKKQRFNIDMRTGTLWDKILLFALPLMASSMLQLLFNAADIVVVGRFAGKEALAAVGSNTALINLMINLFMGLSVGANVVVARDLGAGRMDDVQRDVRTTISLSLVSGLALMGIGVVAVRQLLVWTSSPADVIDLATVYLRIYFCGMPGNLLYNFGAAVLRAQGDTRRPLYFLTAAGIINVVLNLVFVVLLHMDVAGVALATIASQYISAALVLRCLLKDEGPLHVDLKNLGIEWEVVRRILRVGLPAGFQGILFSLSNVVIQSALNSFDSSALVAASSASANLEGFVYAAMNAFHQATITFVGQNYGARLCDRVDRVMKWNLGFVVITGVAMGNLVHFFGEPLAGIYAPGEPEVVALAVTRMAYVCVPYFIYGMMDVLVGALRGLGYSLVPMVVSLVGVCGFRLLWVGAIFPVYHSPESLYVSYPVSWLLTVSVLAVMVLVVRKRAYRKVGWYIPKSR